MLPGTAPLTRGVASTAARRAASEDSPVTVAPTGSPLVWVSSIWTVTAPLPAPVKPGRYEATGAARSSRALVDLLQQEDRRVDLRERREVEDRVGRASATRCAFGSSTGPLRVAQRVAHGDLADHLAGDADQGDRAGVRRVVRILAGRREIAAQGLGQLGGRLWLDDRGSGGPGSGHRGPAGAGSGTRCGRVTSAGQPPGSGRIGAPRGGRTHGGGEPADQYGAPGNRHDRDRHTRARNVPPRTVAWG